LAFLCPDFSSQWLELIKGVFLRKLR
jgi:hypothetical protein